MTSIEVRAYQKALKMIRVNPMARPTTRELLVEMAVEQRKIDIEKACEWIKDNAVVGLANKEVYDFIDDFRKAMNE